MPSPNSDEFHIAYIYIHIFKYHVWPRTMGPCHFPLFDQASTSTCRERSSSSAWFCFANAGTMHCQQLGPTMSGSTVVVMQNDVWINMGVSENRLNPYTQWFCWSLSLLNGYNWGYTPFSDIPTWDFCRLFQTFSERTECWSEKNGVAGDGRWRYLERHLGPMLINGYVWKWGIFPIIAI